MKFSKKFLDIVYFVGFLLVLIAVIVVNKQVEKNELKEQQLLIKDFIELEFSGTVLDYKRVPRGINIRLPEDYIKLGIEGIALVDNLSINDSIVKLRGVSYFYLFKSDENNLFYDTIIVQSGY